MKTFLLLLLLPILGLTACQYDNEEGLYPQQNDTTPCDTLNVTYNGTIKAFLDNKCATSGCHQTGGQAPDLTAYGPAEAAAYLLYEKASDNSHYSRFSWTSCERSQLRIWSLNPIN